jgi:hypothetical protein
MCSGELAKALAFHNFSIADFNKMLVSGINNRIECFKLSHISSSSPLVKMKPKARFASALECPHVFNP